MIWRVGATVGAVAIAAGQGPAPVVWSWLGYQFGAAGMVAAIFGCLVARWWHGSAQSSRKEFRWALDAPITAMTFAAAIALVIKLNPEPWVGLLFGAGVGVVGEGLFKLAERMLRSSGLFGENKA